MTLIDSSQHPIGSKEWKYAQENEIDPDKRFWEYNDYGQKIYKIECGFGVQTLWDGGDLLWEKKYGHDWKEWTKDQQTRSE